MLSWKWYKKCEKWDILRGMMGGEVMRRLFNLFGWFFFRYYDY